MRNSRNANDDGGRHGQPGTRHLSWLLGAAILAAIPMFGVTAIAGVKKVSYPEIKVTLNDAYKADPAFTKMRSAFSDAVAKKDVAALSALVGPSFLWTVQGQAAADLDLGRDALHNFKVAFGFRAAGKDEDGGVDDGPYWDTLAQYAADPTLYTANDAGNLVCGPMAAEVDNDSAYEQARNKIETGDDGADWYFTLKDTPVARSATDTGAPIARVGTVAMPAISFYPSQDSDSAPPATHIEVLLPSGRSGFVPVASMLPLVSDRLCYAKTPKGEWKIALIDHVE